MEAHFQMRLNLLNSYNEGALKPVVDKKVVNAFSAVKTAIAEKFTGIKDAIGEKTDCHW